MFKHDCKKHGHRYEARYDKDPADLSQFKSVKRLTAEICECFRKKTYVRDICVRCGDVVERGE